MERQNPSHRSQAVVDSEAAWRCLVPWLVFFLLIALAGTSRAANVSGVSASPNPFNASLPESTTISYTLANSALLWIRIYDNSSVLKRNLVTPGSYTATNKTAGANNSVWDGKDDSAVLQPDGTYPYRIDNVYFSAHYTGAGTNPQDVVVNPADTQIIWQLNKTSPYVFKSTNGGTNWSSVATTGADSKAYGIAIDSTGNKIYIANNGQSSLRKSTDGGTNWSASGTFPGSITSVYDVATDSTGNTVYVQDYSGNKVYKSTNGGTNWSTCTATGLSLGTTASGITTDSAGTTVIVADSGNNRFYRSTDSCATFSLIPNITAGTAAGQVSYPYQVSIQSDGSFWVSEQTNHRIQLFDSNGKSLMVVGGTSLGSGNYQFDSGAKYFGIGLATISSQPFIFIADYNNTRVKKLGYDNWSSTTHLQVQSSDVTPPANPTGFTATNAQTGNTVNFAWTNPGDADFAGVKIVRATGASAPADCQSGILVYDGTGTSYTEVSLTDGTQYSYRICSYDGVPNYSTGVTASATPTDTTAPSNVSGVTAVPGNTQVVLSWTNPGDLDFAGTKILRKTGGYPSSCTDGTATTVYTGTAQTYTNTGLTNNTTYYYRLCSFDEVPNYPTGATVSAMPYLDTTPPAQVSGFTVSNAGTGGKLNLSWSNPGDADFAGVKIVRATGSTAPANCTTGTVVYNSNGTDYLDTGLTNGQAYAYRACSYDTSGNYATGVTGTATPSDTTAPGNVTNLTATAGNTQVSLSWTNPADSDFAGVKVLRRTDQTPASCTDGAATTVYNGVGTSHVDTGLTNDTTYYYLVCSYDGVPNYPSGVSETGIPGNDTVAPSAVSNLSQNSTVYTRGASLTFTAPGDDADSGTAEVYDVRFTDAVDYPSNITSAYMNTNWATLTQAGGETAPQVAGSAELMTISADSGGAYMKPNTQYYFVMKTADDFGNVSGISNVISVHTALKYGYNLVSVPYKSSTGGANTVNDLMSDDVASVYIFTWESYGLDSGGYFNGDWVTVDPTTAITALSDGKGYYMYAYSMNSSVLDEKNGAESAVMTANSDNWAKMDLAQGRNIVGSPYLKNVDFTNVKICKASTFSTATGCSGGTVVSFSQAVTNAWMDGTIAYYGNSTTYTNETCNGVGCTAKLRPWWGQWVYLLLNDAAYIMAVPKP